MLHRAKINSSPDPSFPGTRESRLPVFFHGESQKAPPGSIVFLPEKITCLPENIKIPFTPQCHFTGLTSWESLFNVNNERVRRFV